jgi:hypothetical protein
LLVDVLSEEYENAKSSCILFVSWPENITDANMMKWNKTKKIQREDEEFQHL